MAALIISFPTHRVRRRPQRGRASAARAPSEALRELQAIEQAQLKLCALAFAVSAVLTLSLGLAL